jgi:hypothetical protein
MSIRASLLTFLLLLAAPAGLAQSQVQSQSQVKAQSLAQIRFEGKLDRAQWVEVEVGATVKGADRRLDVHVFLGPGTTGSDLASLVAGRLEASGFFTHLGEPDADRQGRTVFVERALFINARVGGGLRAVLTACEGPPTSLRVFSPPEGQANLRLRVVAGAVNPVDKSVGIVSIEVDMVAGSHVSRCSEQLLTAAGKARWMSERPETDSWRPVQMAAGARFNGLSVTGEKGWRLELDLRAAR